VVISPPARLQVQIPPVIAGQPAGKSAFVGESHTLAVRVFGTGVIRYQWRFNGADILGATSSTLVLTNLQEDQSGVYTVSVSDEVGSLVSQPASLFVVTPPTITAQPPAQIFAVVGDTVQLSVSAGGTLPLSYRWRRNGLIFTNQILNAYTSILTLPNVQPSNAGLYSVSITNLAITTNALIFSSTLVVQADADGDHVADLWEVIHGFSTNNAADALLDFDRDGVSNLDEFRAGTDPRDVLSYFKVERINAPAAGGGIFLQFAAGSNRSYTVQYTDLDGSTWRGLSNIFPRSTNWKASVTDPAPASAHRFYRLVTPYQPLQPLP